MTGQIHKLRTVYNTANPRHHISEYHELWIQEESKNGAPLYKFFVKYGFWDDNNEKSVNNTQTFGPVDGYSSLSDALADYKVQLERRIQDGFVHCFVPDYESAEPGKLNYYDLSNGLTAL